MPLAGELKLDGTAAVVDQVVTSADIDDNKLTFTPAPGANGDAYASFTFKVNDGTDFSAGAYTITFNVRDLTCAAPDFGDGRRELWSGIVTAAGYRGLRGLRIQFRSIPGRAGRHHVCHRPEQLYGRSRFRPIVQRAALAGRLSFSLTGNSPEQQWPDGRGGGRAAAACLRYGRLRLQRCQPMLTDWVTNTY